MRQRSGLIDCVSSMTALCGECVTLGPLAIGDVVTCTDCVILLLVSTFNLARGREGYMYMLCLEYVSLGWLRKQASKLS